MAGHSKAIYVKVFGALLLLTALTVAISRIHLGESGNVIVGLAIAAAKAVLVGLFFMHLKWDVKVDRALLLTVAFPLILFGIVTLALMPDVAFRLGDAARDVPAVTATTPGAGH